VTTLLYILVGLSALALSSPESLGASSSPLTTALEWRSPEFASALRWIALFSTANTALITLLVASGDLPSLIILRFKEPKLNRPFRVPLSIGKLPLLPTLAIPASLFMAIQFDWIVYATAAGAFVLSTTAYIMLKLLANRSGQ